MIDTERLIAIVDAAARIAAAGWQTAGGTLKVWDKSPDNPVCESDLAVDAFLKAELAALLPSAAWLSEETADNDQRLRHDLLWLVDPIDGTRDFVRGRPGWAVSVALVSNNRPLIGVLHAPARNEIWVAKAGQGATLNGRPLVASTRQHLPGARVPADTLPKVDRDLVPVERPNSIALRMAMVADDRADLVTTLRWGNEWDIGAAALIAREAGAQVTDALGQPLVFNKRDPRAFGVLVAAPGIHMAAVERLADRASQIGLTSP